MVHCVHIVSTSGYEITWSNDYVTRCVDYVTANNVHYCSFIQNALFIDHLMLFLDQLVVWHYKKLLLN